MGHAPHPPEAVVVSGPITPFWGAWTKAQGALGVGVGHGVLRDRQKATDKGRGGMGGPPYDSSYRACLTGLFQRAV